MANDRLRNATQQKINTALLLLIGTMILITLVLVAVLVGRTKDGVGAAGTNGKGGPSTNGTPTNPALVNSYMCDPARLVSGATPAYTSRYWVVLGDEFAAGQGSSDPEQTSYLELMRLMTLQNTGSGPEIFNMAGPSSLATQVAALWGMSSYRAISAGNQPVLVFVSYGPGFLAAQRAASPNGDASLFDLMQQLQSIYGLPSASKPLIPSEKFPLFQVMFFAHPDPAYGGIGVPEKYANCTEDPQMNRPTIFSRLAHTQIMTDTTTIVRDYAKKYGFGFINVDAALGGFSLAQKTDTSVSVWRNCATFNDLGQSLLADLAWRCLNNKTFIIPASSKL